MSDIRIAVASPRRWSLVFRFWHKVALCLVVACELLSPPLAWAWSSMPDGFEYEVPELFDYEVISCKVSQQVSGSKEILGSVVGGAGALVSTRLLFVPSALEKQLMKDQVAVQAMEEYLKQVRNLEDLKARRNELAQEFRRAMRAPELATLRRRFPNLDETPEKLFSRSNVEIRELLRRFEIQADSVDKISSLISRMKANRQNLDVARSARRRAVQDLHRQAIILGRPESLSSLDLRARADDLYEGLKRNRGEAFRSRFQRRVLGAAVVLVTGLGLMFLLDNEPKRDTSKRSNGIKEDDPDDSEWLRCLAESMVLVERGF